ncbi:unnamed protein product [Ectocarpus sp. 13 AM-2016]
MMVIFFEVNAFILWCDRLLFFVSRRANQQLSFLLNAGVRRTRKRRRCQRWQHHERTSRGSSLFATGQHGRVGFPCRCAMATSKNQTCMYVRGKTIEVRT